MNLLDDSDLKSLGRVNLNQKFERVPRKVVYQNLTYDYNLIMIEVANEIAVYQTIHQ